MNILEIIEKKAKKEILTKEEIEFFINGYIHENTITDYQAAALLMAVRLNGMNLEETYELTNAMYHSGNVINIKKHADDILIDKHSTGGVGDKVTLILSPICAALGLKVSKLSGWGLGHTGGTIDKIDSVKIKFELNEKEYLSALEKSGMFVMSQTNDLNPADKKIYRLRNSTSTIDAIPLVASSVVSKKLLINTDWIFLDVKYGDGAFCETLKKAKELSVVMINLLKKFNRKALIHITNMNQPLGKGIGNAIEIRSAINFLNGKFEDEKEKELIYIFVSDILIATKKAKNKEESFAMIDEIINSKKALNKFYEWVESQDGDLKSIKDNTYFRPKYKQEVLMPHDRGYIEYVSTRELGLISFNLGAGRLTMDQKIDYQAGIYLNKVNNDLAQKNEVIATLYSNKPIDQTLVKKFIDNIKFNQKPIKESPVVQELVS